jgi:ribonuclease HII
VRAFDVILGMDEAGLGPILGPLTVGYSAFRLATPLSADALLRLDLWRELQLGREPAERKQRPVVCDSKQLYTPARGVRALEEEVLGWAALAGCRTDDFAGFCRAFSPLSREDPGAYDWYAEAPETFPLKCDASRARLRAQPVARALQSRGHGLLAFGAVAMLEGEFNRAITRLGSKAKAELEVIARVIGHFWREHSHVAVVCDRQGGRAKYGRALSREFPEAQVRAFVETPTLSSYELTVPEQPGCPTLFIAFVEKGEAAHLPVALASMGAKYLRELMMEQFNAWWRRHDVGLKPTAGYYTDGRRWLEDTAGLRAALGVDDRRLVRQR